MGLGSGSGSGWAAGALTLGARFAGVLAGMTRSAAEKGSSSRPNRTTIHSSSDGSRSSMTCPNLPTIWPAAGVNSTFGLRPAASAVRIVSTSAPDNPRPAVGGAIASSVHSFDCALPTRHPRHSSRDPPSGAPRHPDPGGQLLLDDATTVVDHLGERRVQPVPDRLVEHPVTGEGRQQSEVAPRRERHHAHHDLLLE